MKNIQIKHCPACRSSRLQHTPGVTHCKKCGYTHKFKQEVLM